MKHTTIKKFESTLTQIDEKIKNNVTTIQKKAKQLKKLGQSKRKTQVYAILTNLKDLGREARNTKKTIYVLEEANFKTQKFDLKDPLNNLTKPINDTVTLINNINKKLPSINKTTTSIVTLKSTNTNVKKVVTSLKKLRTKIKTGSQKVNKLLKKSGINTNTKFIQAQLVISNLFNFFKLLLQNLNTITKSISKDRKKSTSRTKKRTTTKNTTRSSTKTTKKSSSRKTVKSSVNRGTKKTTRKSKK